MLGYMIAIAIASIIAAFRLAYKFKSSQDLILRKELGRKGDASILNLRDLVKLRDIIRANLKIISFDEEGR